MSSDQAKTEIMLPSSMEDAAKIAHILGRLLDRKFWDENLRGTWEASESMVVGHRGTWWNDRPHTDDPEMQFLLKNKMVQLYSSPNVDAYCIRLLSYHMPKVNAFMRLYTDRLVDAASRFTFRVTGYAMVPVEVSIEVTNCKTAEEAMQSANECLQHKPRMAEKYIVPGSEDYGSVYSFLASSAERIDK